MQQDATNLTPMFSSSRRKSATRDQIASYFHLPIAAASREIGICATLLKKICRKYGIPRWPFRKLKSIEKAMVNLIDSLRTSPQEEGAASQLLRLQRQKENILYGSSKTASSALPAGMNPDELIKLFHLESVASGSESFSDEDDEDSGSNDRKLNAVLQMPPAQYVQELDIMSFAVSAVERKSSAGSPVSSSSPMKYFEPRQAGWGSGYPSSMPPHAAPHMVESYPRSISPINNTLVPASSWSTPAEDVHPQLSAISPTTSPFKLVACSNLLNFKLNAQQAENFSGRRSLQFPGDLQTTSVNYSNSGDSSPPLPEWFQKEKQAAIQTQAKLNLA